MSKPSRSSADPRFYALWALSGALDLPVLALALGAGNLPAPRHLCLLHVLAAVAAFLAPPRERGFFGSTRHWGEAMGLLTFLLPGVGWLLAGWMVAAHGRAPHDKDAYRFDGDEEEDANPLAAAGSPEAVRRELADALDVVPAADALLGQDSALKRGALEALSRIRTPEAIAWIFRARTDPDPEIRFYATSAATQLKRDYDVAIRAAEREAFARPGELAPQIGLQRIRFEYARSGLVEPGIRDVLLGQCRAWLEEPSKRDPGALRLLYHVERDLEPNRALAVLGRLRAADAGRRTEWLKEEAALLFELGRFDRLRSLLSELRPELLKSGGDARGGEEVDWRSAILWWTHG